MARARIGSPDRIPLLEHREKRVIGLLGRDQSVDDLIGEGPDERIRLNHLDRRGQLQLEKLAGYIFTPYNGAKPHPGLGGVIGRGGWPNQTGSRSVVFSHVDLQVCVQDIRRGLNPPESGRGKY